MPTKRKSVEETQIHRLFDNWMDAIRSQDLDKLMACYAPDVVAFDMLPPLQCTGTENYRKNWQMGFDCCQNGSEMEMQDVRLSIGDKVAYCCRLGHITGTLRDGTSFDCWTRWTVGLEKIDGQWKITHEHNSVPIDMETEKGLMNLAP